MKTIEDYQDKAEALRVELAAAKSTIVLLNGIIADLRELLEEISTAIEDDMPSLSEKVLDDLLTILEKCSGK